jgi:murein peptide amidase A
VSGLRRCPARVAAALGLLASVGCGANQPATRSSGGGTTSQTIASRTAPPDENVRRVRLLARSVRGRAIDAIELGDPDSRIHALIIGSIHGSEPAGIAIAQALVRHDRIRETDLWVIPDLNPDGVAADTRGNGHGVDLNRNFPAHWRPLGAPGTTYYAGPRPLSEPESASVAALVYRIRPQLTIYYHQHLALVDDSEGPYAIERRYAADVHLPLRRLTDYPGSATGWQDTLLGPTAFVVELPSGSLRGTQIDAHVDALLDVLPAD